MPRKTDSSNPADWLWIAASDLELIGLAGEREVGYCAARSKLAEVLEKIIKAELLRLGWTLERTHDLERLFQALASHASAIAESADPLCAALAEVYFTDRYPGFDIDDPDWPSLREQIGQVSALLATVQASVGGP